MPALYSCKPGIFNLGKPIAPWQITAVKRAFMITLPSKKSCATAGRVSNLLLGAFGFLMVIWPDDWYVAGLGPTEPRGPVTLGEVALYSILTVWFISAILLLKLKRSRLVLSGSLPGLVFFIWILVTMMLEVWRFTFFPNAEELAHRPYAQEVYWGTFLIGTTFISIALAIATGTLVSICFLQRSSDS